MTGPRLAIVIRGIEYSFMVDTGAMVSLIKPGVSRAQIQSCEVTARGVTGTELEVLGEQEVTFSMKGQGCCLTFKHTFVVSPLEHCSSGILGMDFLQRVGAEISLTAQSLTIGHYTFPLRGREYGVSTVQRLATDGPEGTSRLDQEEGEPSKDSEPVGDWEGTVELAETVTVPPLSVRIARCRVVRRGDPISDKAPRYVLIDGFALPTNLSGIYCARSVATLTNVIECQRFASPVARNALLVEAYASNVMYSPPNKVDAIGKQVSPVVPAGSVSPHGTSTRHGLTHGGVSVHVTRCFSCGDDVTLYAGECQPKCPDSGLRIATAGPYDQRDLQCIAPPSPPVENGLGKQFDTHDMQKVTKGKGLSKEIKSSAIKEKLKRPDGNLIENLKIKKKVLGYVPVQFANLSLEEIELQKNIEVGIASPIEIDGEGCRGTYVESPVSEDSSTSPVTRRPERQFGTLVEVMSVT